LTEPACPAEWATPEQRELYQAVLRLARSLPDDVREHDREGAFPRPAWERCAAFGIQGLPLPAALGGGGADVVTTLLALEALGHGCGDGGLLFSISAHMLAVEIPLWHHGSPEQQRDWLPRLCSGESIGAHAMSEPDSGSDAFALSTTARQVAGGYLLNGCKTFVTNAPVADLLLVFARTSKGIGPFGVSAFLLPAGTPGCAIGRPIEKMGLRTSPMAEVTLSDCFLPDAALLGRPGQGGEIFQLAMRWERACIMATQVGVMRRTMAACARYAGERRQFGKPIGRFQAVAGKLADMRIAVDAAHLLLLRVGWLMDQGHDVTAEAAVAKVFVSEASVRCHLDSVQLHGGYGYTSEFEAERMLRDAVAGTIYSGTSEILRDLIARSLLAW
jgi:alkylation response protein AidB-like acyl-CoA dehydrogenase